VTALLPLLWTVISYKDLLLPRLLWNAITTGSAGN
jgi:hypothetical protein